MPDASFDAVTIGFGLLHLPRPQDALAEVCEVRVRVRVGVRVGVGGRVRVGVRVRVSAFLVRGATKVLAFSRIGGTRAGGFLATPGRPSLNGLGTPHGSKSASGTPKTASCAAASRSCRSADLSWEVRVRVEVRIRV